MFSLNKDPYSRNTRPKRFLLRLYSQLPYLISTERPELRYTPLPSRSLIEVGSNADNARTFIHGLVTADTKSLQYTTSSYYSAFLNASGRSSTMFYLPPPSNFQPGTGGLRGQQEPDQYLIEVDTDRADALIKHLRKHRLRRKLTFRLLNQEEGPVYAMWSSLPELDPFATLKPTLDPVQCWKLDQRPNIGARCILRPKAEMEKYFGPPNATLKDYTIHRVVNGVAEGSGEIIPGTALPQESNIDLFGGIDFRKGCYLGQELTIRTHHTGVVRKRILPVQLYETGSLRPTRSDKPTYIPDIKLSLPPPGSEISKVAARKGRSVGKWLGGVGNIGLALCRLEMMTDIRLTEEAAIYDPDQEFKVVCDEKQGDEGPIELRVKAFIPPWMRVGLQERLERGQTH